VNILVLIASFGLNLKVIVSERIHPPAMALNFYWRVMRYLTYPLAHRVVMLSSESLEWLNNAIPRAKGVVIPNIVNIPLINNLPNLNPNKYIVHNKKVLLAVGRLDKQKQFDLLIDTFFELQEEYKNWNLFVLGEGPEKNYLLSKIRKLNLTKRVILVGKVGNIGDWYLRADLYVMTSKFEGFPNSLIEAMAYGCPAVSFDCDTGPRDIIRQDIDGLLIPNGNIKQLIQALRKLMGDNKLRKKMGKHATEVQRRYSTKKILAKWDAIL